MAVTAMLDFAGSNYARNLVRMASYIHIPSLVEVSLTVPDISVCLHV